MSCNCNKRNNIMITSDETNIKQQENSYGITDIITDKITGNLEYVTENTQNKRLSVCKLCVHLVKFYINGTGNCKKCGCFVDYKVKYVKSKCPVSKW